jgi:serine/threonine protein kinase
MEEKSNRNAPKRLLLAEETGDQDLIGSALQFCSDTEDVNRKGLDALISRFTAVSGQKMVRKMQQGDTDSFFPVASNIYLIEKAGQQEVWKENVRLYTDFSRLDGYNCEKEIYERLAADSECPSESFIDYRGSMTIEGNEFLRFGFFEGKELTDYITEDPKKRLSVKQAARVVRSIAQTLDYLQSKGVLYMDVKDKNFLYDGEQVKILDFGMAQMFDGPVDSETEARSLLSTPAYIPPEWGRTFTAYASSEVFQLGVLFHQLMTGKHPFAQYDFTEGDKHRESEIMKYSLSNMYNDYSPIEILSEPGRWDITCRMLDKDYTARPTMKDVAEELDRYVIDSILDGPAFENTGGDPDV